MSNTENSLQDQVRSIISNYGTVAETARALNIDASYLSIISIGKRQSVGPSVLKRLGLRKVITYERIVGGGDD